jgi:hypothetical protein
MKFPQKTEQKQQNCILKIKQRKNTLSVANWRPTAHQRAVRQLLAAAHSCGLAGRGPKALQAPAASPWPSDVDRAVIRADRWDITARAGRRWNPSPHFLALPLSGSPVPVAAATSPQRRSRPTALPPVMALRRRPRAFLSFPSFLPYPMAAVRSPSPGDRRAAGPPPVTAAHHGDVAELTRPLLCFSTAPEAAAGRSYPRPVASVEPAPAMPHGSGRRLGPLPPKGPFPLGCGGGKLLHCPCSSSGASASRYAPGSRGTSAAGDGSAALPEIR